MVKKLFYLSAANAGITDPKDDPDPRDDPAPDTRPRCDPILNLDPKFKKRSMSEVQKTFLRLNLVKLAYLIFEYVKQRYWYTTYHSCSIQKHLYRRLSFSCDSLE